MNYPDGCMSVVTILTELDRVSTFIYLDKYLSVDFSKFSKKMSELEHLEPRPNT